VEYAAGLGVDTLSLGPVFASSTHGYDTVDHFRIDPRLGDEADFDALIAAAHGHGLKVLLDGVFNHVGVQHPLYQAALNLDARASEFFVWSGGKARVFEGHPDLIELNHGAECVAELTRQVMGHWLDRGADGWRLDAAYATGPDFWGRVVPTVRAEFPRAYFFGELIHGNKVDFVNRSTLDSVTQYELWKAIWSSVKARNFFELSWALKRHGEFVRAFQPVTFIGNHDVTRIASQVGPAGAVLALVVLATVGGSPHIYYGDEQAYTGVKEDRAGGDDAVRPAFPATPGELAPNGWWMYDLTRRLIAVRREHPWLGRAEVTNQALACEQYVYRVSDPANGTNWLDVTLDLTHGTRVSVAGPTGEVFAWSAN
jgi:glycosidase